MGVDRLILIEAIRVCVMSRNNQDTPTPDDEGTPTPPETPENSAETPTEETPSVAPEQETETPKEVVKEEPKEVKEEPKEAPTLPPAKEPEPSSPEPKQETEEKKDEGVKEERETETETSVVSSLKERLTKSLIKAHSVPDELVDLLPTDPDKLEEFLESEKYTNLKNRLNSGLPQPKEGEPSPEPEPKQAKDNPRDALTRIGLSVTGGSI